MQQTCIWIRCNFNYLTPDNRFLYLFNNRCISLKQYDDTRRGPHLNLEVQESLYSGLYTGQNVNLLQERFCHCLWKIHLFIFLPSKLESWTTYFVCSSNCIQAKQKFRTLIITILQFRTFEQTEELLISTPNWAPHDINRNQAIKLQTGSYLMQTKSGKRASEFCLSNSACQVHTFVKNCLNLVRKFWGFTV